MKVKSESEVAQLCPSLSDPMDCCLPGSSVHGIFQARVLEWGAIACSSFNVLINLFYLTAQSQISEFQPVLHLYIVSQKSGSAELIFFKNSV